MTNFGLKKISSLASVLVLSLLAACSEDSAGTDSIPDTDDVVSKVFESVKDLPLCVDSLEGKVAEVKNAHYICSSEEWIKVENFVRGVCNVDVCDDSMEDAYAYIKSKKELYQCKSSKWVDPSGKTFTDKEYVSCYVESIVRDSVASEEDLKTCSSTREGYVYSVGGSLYACASKKWIPLVKEVVSVSDLPECSNTDNNVYVLEKMRAYSCIDGLWYLGTKAVNAVSSSSAKSSSSSAKESSSSSKKSSSSVALEDDGTKVRGICVPVEKEVAKGNPVKWKFVNMGGTPITYNWTIGEGESAVTSTDVRGSITPNKGGVYTAKVVINEGRDSESDEIACAPVEVRGNPVTGCECTTEASSLTASEYMPASETWVVSGCEGYAPFTYEWSDGAEGSGASATATTTKTGSFAPTVIVTNSDGESMSPVCKSVDVRGYITADCSIESDGYLYVSHVRNVSDYVSSMTMTLLTDEGISKNVVLSSPYGYSYYWENFSSSYSLPAVSGSGLHQYTLDYDGVTVCKAVNATCGPIEDDVYIGQTSSWAIFADVDFSANSYSWEFTRSYYDYEIGENVSKRLATSTSVNPRVAFDVAGNVNASVILDKNLPSEKKITCSELSVDARPITGCECSAPELLSSSNDLAEVDEVRYQWKITGCSSEGAEPFTYRWYNATEGENPSYATATYTSMNTSYPEVHVYNKDGTEQYVTCESGVVKKDGVYEMSARMYETLYAGTYYITSCDGESYKYDWTDITASSSDWEEWFVEGYGYLEDYGLRVYFPVTLVIPEGESFTINYCY